MAIKHFTFEPDITDSFVKFGYDHYSDDKNWIPPQKKEFIFQLSPLFPFYNKPGNYHRHFIAFKGKKILGRISAFVNNDLKDKNGNLIGCLGFFECINDQVVSNDLLETATNWLTDDHGIKTIWGPVNFDIWHGYRMMTRGFDQKTFSGEPYNKDFYQYLFTNFGFHKRQLWHSVEIEGQENLEKMVAHGKEKYDHLIKSGYRFDSFNKGRFNNELRKLYDILTESFSGFLGFTLIPFPEFESLFKPIKYAVHPPFFKFVFDEDNVLCGFVGGLLDLSNSILVMNGKTSSLRKLKFFYHRSRVNRIIFYIGGITKHEGAKSSGLGKAAFYHITHQILEAGYDKVVIALMAEGNRMQGLLKENMDLAQREYTLFEKQL